MLRVAAVPCATGAGFDLRDHADLATLVIDRHGHEHLLLSDARASLRIDVTQGSLQHGSVRLRYRLAGTCDLMAQLATMQRFARFCRNGRLPLEREVIGLERAAQALPIHVARADGASLRQIAELLFGAERVAREWPGEGESMKSAARRWVAVGDRLAADPWSLLG